MFCSLAFSKDIILQLDNYKKIGEKLVEFSIFKIDIYIVSYYEKTGGKGKALNLNYQMDISKNLSIKGWEEGFSWMESKDKKKYKTAIKWIFDHTNDLKKSDNLTIYIVDGTTTFKKNGDLVGTTKDKLVSEIVLTPWIGDRPIREDVKKALLGSEAQ